MDYSAVLKPVNEYNIVDRIKEANKELFAPDDEASNGNGKVTKVKFALNLEDYEPSEQQKDPSPSPPDELLEQLTQLKLKPIAEEEPPAAAPEVSKVVEEPPGIQPPPLNGHTSNLRNLSFVSRLCLSSLSSLSQREPSPILHLPFLLRLSSFFTDTYVALRFADTYVFLT